MTHLIGQKIAFEYHGKPRVLRVENTRRLRESWLVTGREFIQAEGDYRTFILSEDYVNSSRCEILPSCHWNVMDVE